MILSTRISGRDGLADRLKRRLPASRVEAALDGAAAKLACAAAANLGRAPTVQATADARAVGSADPAAVARETGTLTTPPEPWLLPAVAALKAGDGFSPEGRTRGVAPTADGNGGTP